MRDQTRQYYFWLEASDYSAMRLQVAPKAVTTGIPAVGNWLIIEVSSLLPKDTTMTGTDLSRDAFFRFITLQLDLIRTQRKS